LKILYVCHRIPYPPNKGDKIRSFNEVRYLAARHQLDLLCLADEPGDLRYQADLEAICARVAVYPLDKTRAKLRGGLSLARGRSISVGYFYQRDVQAGFDRWLDERDYDAIVCFSSTMAEYVYRSRLFGAGRAENGPKLIMDFCDVDSDKWLQYAAEARWPLDSVYRLENRRLAAYERRVQGDFDHTVLISAAEAALFRQICPEAGGLAVIPNGVDSAYFAPSPVAEQASLDEANPAPTLVFTGAMDYHANVDGVCWFSREIWPALKQAFPQLRFAIVGSQPTPAVRELAAIPGITVTGFVDDVRPYYQGAELCVIPLRLARGVQNKVLEAMAMGKAVVTTAKANAGICATDGEHLQVADTAGEFVTAVTALLGNAPQRAVLGQNARNFVVARYDWGNNMAQLEKLLTA